MGGAARPTAHGSGTFRRHRLSVSQDEAGPCQPESGAELSQGRHAITRMRITALGMSPVT